jgi:hypothetical protein
MSGRQQRPYSRFLAFYALQQTTDLNLHEHSARAQHEPVRRKRKFVSDRDAGEMRAPRRLRVLREHSLLHDVVS